MGREAKLTPEERYANRRASQEDYRHRVRRFTLQFSLRDEEVLEWFEKQTDKGKYLKDLMLADKQKQTELCPQVSCSQDNYEMEGDEMAIDFKAMLNEKMQNEYAAFLAELKGLPTEQVVMKAYEKVYKEELLACISDCALDPIEAKALYKQKNPLDYCYQKWLKNDLSVMNMLEDTVRDATKDAVIELRARNRESR